VASFASILFDEPGRSLYAAHGAAAVLDVATIPSGGAWLVEVAPDLARLRLPVQSDGTALDSLRGAVGTSSTLDYVGGTVSAWLVEVGGVVKVKDDADVWRFTLDLWVTGAASAGGPYLLTEDGGRLLTEAGGGILL
jgi:hypothetical protein